MSTLLLGNWKSGRMTPIIVCGPFENGMVRPIALGSDLRYLRHIRSLITIIEGAVAESSPAWNVRPNSALEPRTSKNSAVTIAPDRYSDPSRVGRVKPNPRVYAA